MNNFHLNQNSQILQELMQQVGISTREELSQISGLSLWQIKRLEYGLLPKMSVETLLKLSQCLQVSVENLLTTFIPVSLFPSDILTAQSDSDQFNSFQLEYQRLENNMANLAVSLREQMIRENLAILESWLIYWPTALAAINSNPDLLPAKRIIPLVKPVQKLVESWGLKSFATVGEHIPYQPQFHELIEGVAQEGDLVKVRNVGYMLDHNLYLRAKVGPLSPESA